jgi:hypothetical protein
MEIGEEKKGTYLGMMGKEELNTRRRLNYMETRTLPGPQRGLYAFYNYKLQQHNKPRAVQKYVYSVLIILNVLLALLAITSIFSYAFLNLAPLFICRHFLNLEKISDSLIQL